MTVLKELSFFDIHNSPRKVNFQVDGAICEGVNWTVLTGRNGSYKSMIFREIVQAIILKNQNQETGLTIEKAGKESKKNQRIIAISSTISDRFPLKRQNIKTTLFDQPSYIYFGQRVNANLVSKREIIENVAFHMLDSKNSKRLALPIFSEIFNLVGLRHTIKLIVTLTELSTKKRKGKSVPLYRTLTSVANFESEIGHGTIRFLPETAQFLLTEFSKETFDQLEAFLQGPKRKITINIADIITSDVLSIDAIRLGLYVEQLRLSTVEVITLENNTQFSAFDLSSGEYHLLSTLLAAFFVIQEGDIILVDEPETSLHPQWQIDYIRLLDKISSMVTTGHILIATHSPLIISAVKVGTSIIDVSKKESTNTIWKKNFGGTADDILVGNFGLKSSRSHDFIDKIQKAITLIEQGKDDSQEFAELRKILLTYRNNIPDTDPIVDILDALTKAEQ